MRSTARARGPRRPAPSARTDRARVGQRKPALAGTAIRSRRGSARSPSTATPGRPSRGSPTTPAALRACRSGARAPAGRRRLDLAAAAPAEDAADQRGDRDHVCRLPFLGRHVPSVVFGRHLQRVELRRVDVLVDPRDVFVRSSTTPWPRVPVFLWARSTCSCRSDSVYGASCHCTRVHLAVRRRAAGERGERRAARVAQHVHQEQPVLRAGVARAEHHVGVRLAVDVGDPNCLSRTIVTPSRGWIVDSTSAGLHAERHVLVVARELVECFRCGEA